MEVFPVAQEETFEEREPGPELRRFVESLSAALVGVSTERIDEYLNGAVGELGRMLSVDHAAVLLFARGGGTAKQAYFWTNPTSLDRTVALRERLRVLNCSAYPNSLQARLSAGRELYVPAVAELDDAWEPERSIWRREGLSSLVAVPVALGGTVLGALGLVSLRASSGFDRSVMALLRRTAHLFASALERKRTSRALERQILFATIATRISRAFALARAESLETEVEVAVREVAKTLAADEAHVFASGADGKYGAVHLWFAHADAAERSVDNRLDPSELRWWSERHENGETIVVRTPNDLPLEATNERTLAKQLGFSAAIETPLVHCGEVFGSVGIASRQPRNWAQEEVGLVTLVAELIAQALQQRRARDALRLSEERFQTAVEATNDGLWNWSSAASDDAWWSARLYELLGYQDNQIPASRSVFEAHVHPEDLPRLRAFSQGPASTGNPFQLELRLRPRQGDYFWARLRGRVVSARGNVFRMAGSVQDITEHKQAEAQLLHAQRMDSVGVLAGGIAHDFNNLLTAIQNYARLALRHLEQDPARSADALDGIIAAGDRAATLTHQLLAFSRRQVIRRRTLDLNALIAEMVGMLRRIIPESIRIEFSPGHRLATVEVDPGQFEQVLVNLCVNARDAMPEGGKLRITTDNANVDSEPRRRYSSGRPGSYVQLRVMDTGLGMPHEVRERAFEPFFTTKERGKGTGLGLSTVYGIVRQHGGFVDIESESGAGTAVTVFIPTVDSNLQPHGAGDQAAVRGGSELILVAEDNDLVRRILVQLLEEAGYQVVVARDGQEAVKRFDERPDDFDLLFLDVIMPKMGGRDVYETIQKRRDIKVIFCSGYSGGVFDDEFFRHPKRRLIPKPYDANNLLLTVRQVLDSG